MEQEPAPLSESSGPEGKETSPEEDVKEITADSEPEVPCLYSICPATVKHVLELLCDESGFVIESKLRGLLQPLEKNERTLMRLDVIFMALSINNEDDVYFMVDFFLKHKAMCLTSPHEAEVMADATLDKTPPDAAATSEAEASSVPQEEAKGPVDPSTIYMHPNDILKALKAFVQDLEPRRKRPSLKQMPEERDNSKDSGYWDALAHVIPDGKLKLWNTLIEGLQKYNYILTHRDKLITETEELQKQNIELRMLLNQYLHSPVNAELLIPPTHILNLQLSQP